MMEKSSTRGSRRPITWLVALGTLLSCVCVAHGARAEPPTKEMCIEAHASGQKHVKGGELLAAKKKFITCAQETCPSAVTSACVKLLDEVDTGIPTIVITAADAAGQDVADVRVTVDGSPLVDVLDGKPISLDPGAHTLRFVHADSPPVEQKIILIAGAKYRPVEVRFNAGGNVDPKPPHASESAPPPIEQSEQEDHSGVSPWVYVGFVVAGVGAVVGAITGGISLSQASELKDGCPKNACTADKQEDIDTMLTMGHVSTASFIVAGVGAAVGVIALVVGDSASSDSVAIRPVLAPGFFGIDGRF